MPAYPKLKIQTIDYPESPSGKINISKWAPPFKRVATGFGFYGVVAEDSETGQQQCYVCGGWYELLSSHIFGKHGLTSNDYRDMFGLLRSTALKSMRIRKIQSKVMTNMRKEHIKHRISFKKGNTESANRKGKKKAEESANKYGVCDLQIVNRIIKLKEKLGRTPTLTEVIDVYGGGISSIIHNRYQSYVDYVNSLNMVPVFSSRNPKYSKEFFIRKWNEEVKKDRKTSIQKVFNKNEQRYIYRFFNSYEELRDSSIPVV